MSLTPPSRTYLEPVRDIPTILAHIDALFACLGDVSEEKQQQYVATKKQHWYSPEAIAAIKDRSDRQDALDYNAAVQRSIDANSLDPASMQPLAAEIQSCHKYYKDFHDASWDQNRTYALNLCESMIHVLIPITRRLESYADETTASASGTLSTIIYWIQGSLRSNNFAWDQTMMEAQGRYRAFLADVKSGKKQPIRTVDAVISESIQSWYSPENKHGPNYNPNFKKPAPATSSVRQQLASLKLLYDNLIQSPNIINDNSMTLHEQNDVYSAYASRTRRSLNI